LWDFELMANEMNERDKRRRYRVTWRIAATGAVIETADMTHDEYWEHCRRIDARLAWLDAHGSTGAVAIRQTP
jgi:hypothetical protein